MTTAEADDTHALPEAAVPPGGPYAQWSAHVLGVVRSARALEPGRWVIGRSSAARISIADDSVSREHAALEVGAAIGVEDLGSRNGTFVDGRRVAPGSPVELSGDAVIRLGTVVLVITRTGAGPERPLTTEDFERALAREAAAARREGELGQLTLRFAGPVPAVEDLRVALGAIAITAPVDGEVRAIVPGGVAAGEAVLTRLAVWLGARGLAARTHIQYHPRPPEAVAGRIVVSPAMARLHDQAAQLAAGAISVLIVGETGVGKEVFAEAVWRGSKRAARRLVRVNCAAIADTLLESELFGHERGAFSGALVAKAGLLEEANAGTLLLDEIGELSAPAQAKLLRCLEDGQVTRVGGVRPRPIDVRFLAATNRNLEHDVARGAFRRDLYFRIAGAILEIPPLRQRAEEILPLAQAFVAASARELGTAPPTLARSSEAILLAYRWPGNIRELRNAMARAVLLADRVIEPAHLPTALTDAPPGVATEAAEVVARSAAPPPPAPRADDAERARLARVLAEHGGNQTKAAEALGISRVTLGKWLQRHGVPRPRK